MKEKDTIMHRVCIGVMRGDPIQGYKREWVEGKLAD